MSRKCHGKITFVNVSEFYNLSWKITILKSDRCHGKIEKL
jgi:hypothetical protein